MAEADEPLALDILADSIITQTGEGVTTSGEAFKVVAFTANGWISKSQIPVKINMMLTVEQARDAGCGLIVAGFLVEQAPT